MYYMAFHGVKGNGEGRDKDIESLKSELREITK
jgi:hypothetical protein